MKTRTNFTHRVDMWDDAGQNIIEHLAGRRGFRGCRSNLSSGREAMAQAVITLRQGARVIHDSRKLK